MAFVLINSQSHDNCESFYKVVSTKKIHYMMASYSFYGNGMIIVLTYHAMNNPMSHVSHAVYTAAISLTALKRN